MKCENRLMENPGWSVLKGVLVLEWLGVWSLGVQAAATQWVSNGPPGGVVAIAIDPHAPATVRDITLPARGWSQVNRILAQYTPQVTQGYALVICTSGNNPFIAYAVINDGAAAGDRTGDGAFISSAP